MGKIVNVTIEPGCIASCLCESACPEVFAVESEVQVRPGAEQYFASHADKIREAAEGCPVSVIQIEEG